MWDEESGLRDEHIIEHDSPYGIGPETPPCPFYEEEEVVDHQWPEMEIMEYELDSVIDTRTAAYEWADSEYEDPKLVVGVTHIQWKGDEYEIAPTFDADDWFPIRAGRDHTVLLIPRTDRTKVVEYEAGGDC
ncbi:hypothetical protein BRC82_03035 [Halobacteriales archaeon QS_1_67_19]|nr:MAG: hypothetical protein BRC82_03035 [Halobacteriales archaeon QS_1_67_19]